MNLPDDVVGLIVSYAPLEFLSANRAWGKFAADMVETTKDVYVDKNHGVYVTIADVRFIRVGVPGLYFAEYPRVLLEYDYRAEKKRWKIMRAVVVGECLRRDVRVFRNVGPAVEDLAAVIGSREIRILQKIMEVCG